MTLEAYDALDGKEGCGAAKRTKERKGQAVSARFLCCLPLCACACTVGRPRCLSRPQKPYGRPFKEEQKKMVKGVSLVLRGRCLQDVLIPRLSTPVGDLSSVLLLRFVSNRCSGDALGRTRAARSAQPWTERKRGARDKDSEQANPPLLALPFPLDSRGVAAEQAPFLCELVKRMRASELSALYAQLQTILRQDFSAILPSEVSARIFSRLDQATLRNCEQVQRPQCANGVVCLKQTLLRFIHLARKCHPRSLNTLLAAPLGFQSMAHDHPSTRPLAHFGLSGLSQPQRYARLCYGGHAQIVARCQHACSHDRLAFA